VSSELLVYPEMLAQVLSGSAKPVLSYSPLHMAVLMRKSDLVKRYCCVLQILESSLDLINDEKLVRLIFALTKAD